ncbi:Stearoyl-CoA 9-desaturase electron transfer partner [Streptomyces lavendulae subsp. lavendulae]|uniref:Stearoyl-CoA 9-desaturase electron transfer partner n=1 Tax=Streptomyces lavendulae subsp. lavendulae TaxID=58340 RepID=A0A2K8PPF8_STRLA|nr:ferredoxin reductase family protein [Streptomyces lavendulae]ATZ28642.1 Stearoyl-CoA 9-desaturase electron transfer partner [Streptomyces lavendulae subsp. lavendulae]QUQ58467.1 Dihydroorotate dehydrogenase B (NAD(+)), electron transfer subunit [Streptomyces lavendulae subsp. lavendulae]
MAVHPALDATRTSGHGAVGPPLAPRLVPTGVHVLGWAGAAGVLGLWWANTTSVVGAAGWFTGAGRITGLLAGYVCAVVVVLMARVPWLDRTVGSDRLARWHAAGGRYAISLVLAHTLLIIWGYALTGHAGPVDETVGLVLHYPEMLGATAAWFLFLLTAVVSARAARRRLSYETWQFLHLATYAAIYLAFGHQLADGADFVGNRTAQALWYAMYLSAAGLVVWFRFLAPVRSARRHRLTVAQVRREGPDVVSVHLTGDRLDELAALPGQFFRWRFLARGLWWTASPYSLSAPPHPRSLRITVKALGSHSAALTRLAPGTRVWAEGPYGALTARNTRADRTLLLAGGIGITPLRALFETLPGDLILIYWARTPADLVLRGELDAIAAARGARVYYSVDEPDGHALPLTAPCLTALVPDLGRRDVYLCGPPGMTRAAGATLREAGVAPRRIHQESFAL